jgi:glucose dehydrogenase
MWLPEPIYESLPYVYVACGALMLSGAVYVGIGSDGTPYYLLIGFLSILGGVVIYLRRMTARKQKSGSDLSET